jgi:hypothetical protein
MMIDNENPAFGKGIHNVGTAPYSKESLLR